MSPYLAGGMLIAFIAWSGLMYHEGSSKESAVCGKNDAQHDLAQANITVTAEKGIIATVGQQQTVTQGVDNAYQAKKSSIDNQYIDAFISVRPTTTPASNGLPTLSNTPSRPDAGTARSFRTKVYKLNAQECDDNTEQLYGLQAWVKGQQSVKLPAE